jgi:Helicase HerA, central domain
MQVTIGKNTITAKPVHLDTMQVINGHLQIAGITGMGKTHRLIALVKSIVESASQSQQALRVHVFDPHGDIDLPYASEVVFSEATPYGYNPLEINPDPDYGGVRRSIQKFIAAIQKHKALGTKQEAVMRYLLEDLFAARGFYADDPRSWIPDDPRMVRELMHGKQGRVYLDVAYEHRARFKELLKDPSTGRYCGGFDDFNDEPDMRAKKCWWVEADHYDGDFLMWEPKPLFKTPPTMDDAVRFTERKLKAHFCGTNSAAMTLLNDVNRAARGYHRKVGELSKRGATMTDAEMRQCEADLDKSREKAGQAYTSYLAAIASGRELDDLIRYTSTEVLTSVYERFQNLRAIGIYNPVLPPFNAAAPIWRYIIKPLEIPVQRMFVDMVCARIFERAMQRGVQKDLVEIIVLDEGKRYVTEDDDDILSKIANEARKFGLGLWVASQTPAHFTDDFLKATGTILILGLAQADKGLAARKLGINEALLGGIIPRQTALVQIKNKGVLDAAFQMVRLV